MRDHCALFLLLCGRCSVSQLMAFELGLEPSEKLSFKGAPKDSISCQLEITNGSKKRQAWKVKCTDNQLFRIRPVVGLLNANEKVDVCLTMAPVDEAPSRNHHFVVYQMEASDEATNARGVWEAAKGDEPCKRLPVEFQLDKDAAEEKDEGEKAAEAQEGDEEEPTSGEAAAEEAA